MQRGSLTNKADSTPLGTDENLEEVKKLKMSVIKLQEKIKALKNTTIKDLQDNLIKNDIFRHLTVFPRIIRS